MVHIRALTPSDLPRDLDILVTHRAALIREVTPHTQLRQADYRRWLQTVGADAQHWVAEQAGQIVGSVGLLRWTWAPSDHPGARGAFIYGLYVDPLARHQGLATQLLMVVQTWATAEGLDHLTVLQSPLSGRLYPQAGYRPVSLGILGRLLLLLIWVAWSRRLLWIPLPPHA